MIKLELADLADLSVNMDLLKKEFPFMCNDAVMILCRPFRFVFDPTIDTAMTDGKALICLSPRFFAEGFVDAAYGSLYHETGHILQFTDADTEALVQAREQGPEMDFIVSTMLDRRDDWNFVRENPGFALKLRRRLAYICLFARYYALKEKLKEEKLTNEQILRRLKNTVPEDAYEDFFFAAKWHRSPRFKVTMRAMKQCRRSRLEKAHGPELLYRAQKVRDILGDMPSHEKRERLFKFLLLIGFSNVIARPTEIDARLKAAIGKALRNYVAMARQGGINQLVNLLKSQGINYPGSISVGLEEKVPLERVRPKPENVAKYQKYLAEVQPFVEPLIRQLKMIDSPSEIELRGQYEGELDTDDAHGIALGLPDVHKQIIVERDVDARIDLAIDGSGSMSGDKIEKAKQISVLHTETVLAQRPALEGRTWGFDSLRVWDFGPVSRESGFVNMEGRECNSDTHLLDYAGASLLRSTKRRKILLVLCDNGPDNIDLVRKKGQQLLARGVIPIHLLIGVHGTPQIYPIELIFSDFDECIEEIGSMLKLIISHLR